MSQSPSESNQIGGRVREKLLDIYTIHEYGNSRTVTVPAATGLEPKTVLCMRLGRLDGRVVYLKAIEQNTQEVPPTPRPSDISVRTETGVEAVRETGHEFREVRGDKNERMMTVPAEYGDDETFAVQSRVAMLTGYTNDGTRYLRIIPEDVLADRLCYR